MKQKLSCIPYFAVRQPEWLAASLAVAVAISIAGCNHDTANKTAKAEAPKAEPITAKVITIEPSTWPVIVRCQGSLVADDQTVIGSRVAGIVEKVLVDVGDQVKPSQVLVQLDDREFELQARAAEAALMQVRAAIGLAPEDPVSKLNPLNAPPVREARATLDEASGRRERWELLRRQNAVAEEELQTLVAAEKVAEARYSSALNSVNSNIALVSLRSAELDLANQRLRDANIAAPFSGYVQARHIAQGTYVQVGVPLVTVVRMDVLRFRGTVPERLATEISLGQTVRLTVESVSEPFDAKITRISPALDLASRSLTFEAVIDNTNAELRAGLFAEAEVTIDPNAKAVVIDKSALVEFAGSQKIWKVINGSAAEQIVQPGRRVGDQVEILSGLKAGDQILANGTLGRIAKVIPANDDPKATAVAEKTDKQSDRSASPDPLPAAGEQTTKAAVSARQDSTNQDKSSKPESKPSESPETQNAG